MWFRFNQEVGGAGVGFGSSSAREARRHIDLFFPAQPASNSFLRWDKEKERQRAGADIAPDFEGLKIEPNFS